MDHNLMHERYPKHNRDPLQSPDSQSPKANVLSTPSTQLRSEYCYAPSQPVSSQEGSSFPATRSTPPSSVPSGAPIAEKRGKRTNVSQNHASATIPEHGEETLEQQTRQADADSKESYELISPIQQEFEADPAHSFWKWSVVKENWYHKDGTTGAVLWAPRQLD